MIFAVNIFYCSLISQYLLIIAFIISSFLLLQKLQGWLRVFTLISRIPGPKAVPILGHALLGIGDTECKLFKNFKNDHPAEN